MKVEGNVILITGASSGIGEALAWKLSRLGAKLVLLARRQEKLEALAAELTRRGAEVIAVPADVTDQAAVAAAVEKTVAHFGRLDILINSAGLGYFGSLARMPMTDLERILRTNIFGVMHATQAALPHLRASQGLVVNVSSALSKRSLPFLAAYAGTKSMLDALSDGMRMEFRKWGVKVMTYCPPSVETDFGARSLKEPGMADMADGHGKGRGPKPAKPEAVADRMVDAIRKGKREVVEGSFLRTMNFFAPKLLDKIFYKAMVERMLKD